MPDFAVADGSGLSFRKLCASTQFSKRREKVIVAATYSHRIRFTERICHLLCLLVSVVIQRVCTMLEDFDKLVARRAALKAWWSLGTTIAQYDSKFHTLRVDLQKPSMVTFCGQQYAGAKNYHDAPDWFRQSITDELQNHVKEITRRAYEAEMERLTELIEKHRAAVLAQLEAV